MNRRDLFKAMLALGGEELVRPWERKRAYSFLSAPPFNIRDIVRVQPMTGPVGDVFLLHHMIDNFNFSIVNKPIDPRCMFWPR